MLMMCGLGRSASPYLDVIDPDVRGAVESDSVAAPDILSVQVPDLEVLEDHVVRAACDSESFASDNTIPANALDSLIARYHEWVEGSLVVSDAGFRCRFLVVVAPVVRVDRQLTRGPSAVRCASSLRGCTFGVSEVEGLGNEDVERTGLTEVVSQLGVSVGSDCCS